MQNYVTQTKTRKDYEKGNYCAPAWGGLRVLETHSFNVIIMLFL